MHWIKQTRQASRLYDFLSKGRHNKLNSKQRRCVFSIENWVNFNNIHPNEMTRFSNKLHDHMSFAIGQTTSYWCTDTWRVFWIESVHIEAQVNAVSGFSC